MATAIPELIAQELVTRLQAITTDNGYDLEVVSVTRVNRDAAEWTPKHLSLVVVQGDDARNEVHDYPGNPAAFAYELPFEIYGFIRQPDRTTTPDQQMVNALQAAVKKAVAGTSDWHTFDSNSYLADWGTTEPYTSTDHAGMRMEVIVKYRVSELDPFVVR